MKIKHKSTKPIQIQTYTESQIPESQIPEYRPIQSHIQIPESQRPEYRPIQIQIQIMRPLLLLLLLVCRDNAICVVVIRELYFKETFQ